jgi:hypothetical protein
LSTNGTIVWYLFPFSFFPMVVCFSYIYILSLTSHVMVLVWSTVWLFRRLASVLEFGENILFNKTDAPSFVLHELHAP